jgi:hypothetical protein
MSLVYIMITLWIVAVLAREEHRYESPAKRGCAYRAGWWSRSRQASEKRPTVVL